MVIGSAVLAKIVGGGNWSVSAVISPPALTVSMSLTRLTPIGGKDIGLPRINKNLDDCP
jgi:hypothetical protein